MYVEPNPQAGDMGEGGDSGGPVFLNNPAKAWGEIVCGFTGIFSPPDVIFMPQDYFADIGVQVKIA